MNCRLRVAAQWGLLVGLVAWLAAAADAADAPATPDRSRGLGIQRIFVPADRPETWPLGDAQFVPVRRDAWQQLLEASNEQDLATDGPPPEIIAADYTLRLPQPDRLTGEAVLAVRLSRPRPTITPLVPLSPRITLLTTSDSPRSSLAGNWIGADDDGDASLTGVLLQESGEIRFELVQRGVETGGGYRFALGLPSGVRQTLTLETPDDVDVQLDRAWLQSRTGLPAGRLRWVFLLGPGGQRELRIVTANPPTAETLDEVQYSQDESYRLATHGLDYETTFVVRPIDDRALELELQTSDELKLLQATVDGLPAPWTSDGFSPSSRIVLAPTGQPHTVRLRGAARIVLDRPWELPTVRLRDALWTEGAVRLWVDPRLELSALNPLDAHLDGLLGLDASTPEGEVYGLQMWNVQSGVEITASRPQQPLAVDVLTEVVLDDVVETLQTTLVLQGRRPHDFHVELPVAAGWRVESVDSTPTGEVLHWRVVDQKGVAEQGGGETDRADDKNQPDNRDNADPGQLLQVQFRTAPTDRTPLVLKVAGKRSAAAIDLPAPARDFAWLDVSAYRLEQQLLWLSGRQSDDRIVAASTLSAAGTPADEAAARFRVARPGATTVALDLKATPLDATIDLERREPAYEAESVVACAAGDPFTYQIELSCRPRQGAVRDLPIVFSRPLPAAAQWSLGTQGAALAVTPLDAPASDHGPGDPPPSVYRVYLPEPTSEPFRLTVVYQRPGEAVHAVDGAILPDAQRFSSWAVLLGNPAATQIDGRSCAPAPLPARDATLLNRLPSTLPVLGAYRYDENYPLRLGLAPAVSQRLDAAQAPVARPLLCHWVEQTSLHAEDGQIRCRSSYFLAPREQESVVFTFPTDVADVEAWIDQTPAVATPSATTPRQVTVLLPKRSDAVRLMLEFDVVSTRLDEQSHVTDPWPTPSFATPTGRWTVWTPPRYLVEADEPRSVSIVERLCGPLARPISQPFFRPWLGDDWRLPGRVTAELKTPYRHAQQLLRRLDHQLATTPSADRRTVLQETLAGWLEATSILVDAAALSVDLSEGAGTKFPIALAVTPEAIVVTTPRQVAHWWSELARTASERVYVRRDARSRPGVPWEGLMAATAWLKASPGDRPPAAGAQPTPLAMEGWRATQLTMVGAATPPLLIVPARERIVWKAYWVVAAVAGFWLARSAPRQVGPWVLVMAVLCLAAPLQWLVLPQAALLGVAIGWLAAWLGQKVAVFRHAAAHATTLTAPALLALLAISGQPAFAETGEPPRQVLIPIDGQGQTVGDEIYVPADLLRQLQARQADDPYDRQAAVLRGGRWQLVLPANDETLPPEHSSLTLRGETFRPGVALTLPLNREDAGWLDAAHRLNGAPVEIDWLAEGGCRISLGRPGEFELRLLFRPLIRQGDGRGLVSMAIPRLPASELQLRGVDQVDDVAVADSVEITHDDNLGQATALLSATDRLEVSWRPRTTVSRRVRVEQLRWLTISPAGSRTDALIRLTGTGLAPQELELQLSGDLRLADAPEQEYGQPLKPEREQGQEQDEPGPIRATLVENNRVVLEIEPGTQLPLEIPLAFQLKRTVSIGRIPMPRIRVVGIEEVRSWFAASVDSRLNYEESSGAALRRVPVSEFADRWGSAERQPATAWAVDESRSSWSIRVWPRRVPIVAEQTLRLWRHETHATIDYAVDIAARQQDASVYRFETPRDFTLGRAVVTLAGDSTPIPIRFSASKPGHVAVFLGRPVQAAHRIVLSGEQSFAPATTQRLPRFRLRDAELGPLELLLDRDRQVDVALAGAAFVPIEQPPEPPAPEFARVGAYRLDDAALENALLKLAPNRIEASAETVIRVVPDSQPPAIEFWMAIDVQQGIVDRLTLLSPVELTDPHVADGDESTAVRISRNQSDQRIECFLRDPITAGEQRLVRIRGQLASAADRRIRLPDIHLETLEETSRYVVLPSMLEDRSLRWVWDNLYPRRLPPALEAAASERSVSFRVTGEHFSAEQQIRPDSLRRVMMRSAEVSAAIDASGHVVAASRYVLQPGNVQQCKLRLPEGAVFISLSVGGRPIATAPDDRAWQPITLSPPLMPIEIVARYRYQLPDTGTHLALAAPQLEIAGRGVPTPVRWEIAAAEGLQLIGTGGAKSIDRASFVALGRQQRWESVQQASLLALQLPDWEARQWYDGWRREFSAMAADADLPAGASAVDARGTHWEMLSQRFELPGASA